MANRAISLLVPTTVGLAAGAVGTFFVLWAQNQSPANVGAIVATVALAITVVGWFKSTQLSSKAQRDLLHLQLLNEGRRALVRALHVEQDRIQGCAVPLHSLRYAPSATDELRGGVAKIFRQAMMHPGAFDWLFALEEHQALFPEVRTARLQLAIRVQKIHEELQRYADVLAHPSPLPRQFDDGAAEFFSHLTDHAAMLRDLALHVQSRAFGAVSGHRAEERKPPDARVPRLIMNDGQLVMHVPDDARRVQMEVAGWLPSRNPPGS